MISFDVNLNEFAQKDLEELASEEGLMPEELVEKILIEYLEDTKDAKSAQKAQEESKGQYITNEQLTERLGF